MKHRTLLALAAITCLHVTAIQAAEPMVVPEMVQQSPAAGKRVKIVPGEYVGSDVYYSLYLPETYKAGGRYPVIVEYTGNEYPKAGSTGRVKDAHLGYAPAKSLGAIWIVLPYVDGDQSVTRWWGDELQTIEYALTTIRTVCMNYGGDPAEVFLCGFSRGAIGVNYLGLHNAEIADVWLGFFSHDHYDGLREWRGQEWGSPIARYRKQAAVRLQRLSGRAALVSHASGVDELKQYLSTRGQDAVAEVTLLAPPIQQIIPGIPTDKVVSSHTDQWLLYPSDATDAVLDWFAEVRRNKPGTFTISGRITDSNGAPVEGIIIDSRRTHFARSDAEGIYIIKGLVPGQRTVRIAPENHLSTPVSTQTVRLNRNRADVDFAISPGS